MNAISPIGTMPGRMRTIAGCLEDAHSSSTVLIGGEMVPARSVARHLGRNLRPEEALAMTAIDPVYQAIDARIRHHGDRLTVLLAKPGPVSTPDGLIWPEQESTSC